MLITNKHVLVVDDNRMARYIVRKVLEPLAVNLREATDGKEALRMVADHKPDLIVLDLQMPNINGPQLFQHLRRKYEGIRVILMSAEDRTSILDRLVGKGADDYIVKPIEAAELQKKAREVLRR